MRQIDKARISAWVLLSVFVPMILLSSLHIHPQAPQSQAPCHECVDHQSHDGHISTAKPGIDCFLCLLHNGVYRPSITTIAHISPSIMLTVTHDEVHAVLNGNTFILNTRAPPSRFCV